MPVPDTSSLKALIHQIIPASAGSPSLTRELVDHAQYFLDSYLGGPSYDDDLADLANLMQRHLTQISSSSTPGLRLTNLLSRLYDQPALSRKHAALNFLYLLSQQDQPTGTRSTITNPPQPSHARRNGPSPFNPTLDLPFSSGTNQNHRGTNGIQQPRPPDMGTAGAGEGLQSKAALLRAYRERIGKIQVPTPILLRDAIYLLQGISGHCVRFTTVTTDTMEKEDRIEFVETADGIIPPPTRVLVHRIAELGHLHRLITGFLDERSRASDVGLVEQSLHHELRFQLTEYHKLIALLESHASRSKSGEDGGGLTLMRMEAWVSEWKLRLRLMSVLVEGSKNAHGGKLISLIHAHTSNGDPFIRSFSTQILEQVSKPFFTSLQAWLFAGSLNDPFGEFFVSPGKRSGSPDGQPREEHEAGVSADEIDADFGGDIHRTWQEKWTFRIEMMPSFLNETFGKKVYSTGKSLNFIRYNCHDAEWVTKQASASATAKALKYSDISGLEQSIDAAYRIASQRLFDAFFVKYKLMDHLQALKAYLLCGYGDFADLLMESLSALLSKPANALYRHTLTTRLLDAVKGSNAQYDPPDVLRRLDARMLEYSHGEIGWDVFTLEYKVDPPIDTVLNPAAINSYLRLFNHLWKMRRVEGSLGASWGRVSGGARTMDRVPELRRDWHQIRVVMAEMIHFVRQMHAWCHREVIGAAWKDLMEFVQKKEGDLDALIEAHDRYLSRMVKKVLLQDSKRGHENNLAQVREIFSTILQFEESTEDFWRYSTHEAHIRDRARDQTRGVYTAPSVEPRGARPSAEALDGIIGRTREYSAKFSQQVASLFISLSAHPDLDIRFLAVSLTGFGGFYAGRRESSRA